MCACVLQRKAWMRVACTLSIVCSLACALVCAGCWLLPGPGACQTRTRADSTVLRPASWVSRTSGLLRRPRGIWRVNTVRRAAAAGSRERELTNRQRRPSLSQRRRAGDLRGARAEWGAASGPQPTRAVVQRRAREGPGRPPAGRPTAIALRWYPLAASSSMGSSSVGGKAAPALGSACVAKERG